MLVGGVWTLFSLRKSLASGIKSGFAAARKSAGTVVAATERDLPMKRMLVALVAFVVPLGLLYQRSEEHTSELRSLMRISNAVFGLKHEKQIIIRTERTSPN